MPKWILGVKDRGVYVIVIADDNPLPLANSGIDSSLIGPVQLLLFFNKSSRVFVAQGWMNGNWPLVTRKATDLHKSEQIEWNDWISTYNYYRSE